MLPFSTRSAEKPPRPHLPSNPWRPLWRLVAKAVRTWPTDRISLAVLSVGVAAGTVLGVTELVSRQSHGRFEPGSYHAASTTELQQLLVVGSMDLEAIRRGNATVPRLLLTSLPDDFQQVASADERRRLFISALLPLLLQVNEEIQAERQRILKMPIMPANRAAEAPGLRELAARYEADPDNPVDLLTRVDTVSPAIALAQAAQESGWGASRFASLGNALFGQRVWSVEAGLAPLEADTSEFAVRSFPTLLDSVRAYALNLNSHPAYESFRQLRAAARSRGQRPDPLEIAATLEGYSEHGSAYVRAITAIIADNSLIDFEGAEIR